LFRVECPYFSNVRLALKRSASVVPVTAAIATTQLSVAASESPISPALAAQYSGAVIIL
jgi:hypothetical protein